MAFRVSRMLQPMQLIRQAKLFATSKSADVPKGYFAVYVGESQKKRYVVPISFLSQPSFQDLLRKAEDECGFDHPMGRLTIPCSEKTFADLTSNIQNTHLTL
ncbi:hypothetical protein EUTSA_v10015720mg [Eutrema salsugineum]|uniref:Uncharacterized protein n=1 Tax=Eutrema salsugineum TaxID=72664 RepID=V4LPM4_EUTSA|nr:auxin-responsive protein SAUR21 [Eutrema salsugineum]ESQ41803.1 hypothetical protein EUTSA_v10015720mg [Eutrema salsugineum]